MNVAFVRVVLRLAASIIAGSAGAVTAPKVHGAVDLHFVDDGMFVVNQVKRGVPKGVLVAG